MKTVEQQHAASLASESESQDAQIQNVSFQRGLFLLEQDSPLVRKLGANTRLKTTFQSTESASAMDGLLMTWCRHLLEVASLSLVQSAQLTLNSQRVATSTDRVVMVALPACPAMLG